MFAPRLCRAVLVVPLSILLVLSCARNTNDEDGAAPDTGELGDTLVDGAPSDTMMMPDPVPHFDSMPGPDTTTVQ
jgi:hypothetical protein